MVIDTTSGIRMLGSETPYADGGESRVLAALEHALDRSSASDELAAQMVDWPTQYHFSRLRSNLLRPLDLRPGTRVLDVGCGTGTMLRYLGERGVVGLGLEASLDRARAAAARCDGLATIEVVCGNLDQLDDTEGFDAILLIGVLEYSGSASGGGGGPHALLERAAALLRPGGHLILAIENALGLKYLIGENEDHLALPWIGVEGYADPRGIRTWSRRGLGALLTETGFPEQHWLYPYPDYKLPTTIVDEQLWERPDAAGLVGKFVRQPVVDHSGRAALVCDAPRAHRTLLEAGLGADIANSFLVVCGATGSQPSDLVRPGLIWLSSGERQSTWIRQRVLDASGPELVLVTEPRETPIVRQGWLTQTIEPSEAVHGGAVLEDVVLDALARHDIAAAREALGVWSALIVSSATEANADAPVTPFSTRGPGMVLPGWALDLTPRNVVFDHHGIARIIDREWVVDGELDADIVAFRACRLLAETIVLGGLEHPWAFATTVADATHALGELSGFSWPAGLAERWYAAEADLQAKVAGHRVDDTLAALRRSGDASRSSAIQALPFLRLRRDLARLADEHAVLRVDMQAMIDQATSRADSVEAASRSAAAAAAAATAAATEERSALASQLADAQARHSMLDTELAAVRAGHAAEIAELQGAVSARTAERDHVDGQLTMLLGSRTWRMQRVLVRNPLVRLLFARRS